MALHLTGSSSVSRTVFIGAPVSDNALMVGYKAICTNSGIGGAVTFTLYWTDPYVGAQTVTLGPLSLLSLGASQYTVFPLNQKGGTTIDYSVSAVGVIGTPTYDIQLLYSPAT